jgi:hypothetical protein
VAKKIQPAVKKLRRETTMRKILQEQIQIGEIDINAIEIELHNRDEIPQILRGLRHIYGNAKVRRRVFDLLLALVPEDVQRKNGRNGWPCGKFWCLACFF